MTQIRTDLALEAAENLQAGGPAAGELSGVVTRTERRQGVSVTEVRILDETGARALGRPWDAMSPWSWRASPFRSRRRVLPPCWRSFCPVGRC